ncbi:GIY-YIG nuclease family protein [Rhodococcus qingshengii]|uniref:GIY-YIG nuclease family protein n=1 Tax=Rhodococcus TaxID=1827 RepID=UPI000F627462|nr:MULTISPECIES: DNA translocase FtsK [Rhodococcus]AZI61881.1 hypothetical protein EHW12_12390 [Rhodococcus sp. NJ-530]BDQ20088.1 GIY-YIG nuclease family protein [Rhodococcus qingshengii]
MKYVYILRNGTEFYKVGMSVNVVSRMAALQTANPEKIELVCLRLVSNGSAVEAKLHKFLVQHKSGGGQEWFRLDAEQAIALCILLNHEREMKLIAKDTSTETLLATMQAERRELFDVVSSIHQNMKIDCPAEEAVVLDDSVDAKIRNEVELVTSKLSDDQYEAVAMDIFRKHGRASASLLQRRLRIGYSKAARIVDNLEERGLISSQSASSPVGRSLLG